MKLPRFCIAAQLLALGVCLLPATESSAATLLDDTFADGDRTNNNLPSDTAFYFGKNDPANLNVTPGSLAYVPTSSSSKAHFYFTEPGEAASLNVGDTLSFSVTWVPRISMNFDDTSRSFRFGVFRDPSDPRVLNDTNDDGGGGNSTTAPFDPWTDAEGYGVQIAMLSDPANTRAPFDLGKRTDLTNSSLLGSSGAYTKASGGDPVAMSVNTEYTYTMDISKISPTQTDVTMSLSDATGVLSTHTVSDNGVDLGADAPYDDFDFVHFRWSNQIETANTFQFRRLLVEGPTPTAIPEPSTALLALLSSASLGLVRRRK
jgi:hypothetical protein